ncbi:hypothetical protein D3C81_2285730 [compost metagenome]
MCWIQLEMSELLQQIALGNPLGQINKQLPPCDEQVLPLLLLVVHRLLDEPL